MTFVPPEQTYDHKSSRTAAIAKSGTVTLELALHGIPISCNLWISPLDLFIARDLLRIRLPYYCLVNIIHEGEVFPELFGPNFTEERLYAGMRRSFDDAGARALCKEKCQEIKDS